MGTRRITSTSTQDNHTLQWPMREHGIFVMPRLLYSIADDLTETFLYAVPYNDAIYVVLFLDFNKLKHAAFFAFMLFCSDVRLRIPDSLFFFFLKYSVNVFSGSLLIHSSEVLNIFLLPIKTAGVLAHLFCELR